MGSTQSSPLPDITIFCQTYAYFACQDCCPTCPFEEKDLQRLKARALNNLNLLPPNEETETLGEIIQEFTTENYFQKLDELFDYCALSVRKLLDKVPQEEDEIVRSFLHRYEEAVEEWSRLRGSSLQYRVSLPLPAPHNAVIFEDVLRRQHEKLSREGCSVWSGDALRHALLDEVLVAALGYPLSKVPGQW